MSYIINNRNTDGAANMNNFTLSHEYGYQSYTFDSRGTHYQVLNDDPLGDWTLFMHRHSLSGTTPAKVFDSLEQLSKHSKTLKAFADFITADNGDTVH